jgi:outer membrane immunogenic protein
MPALRRILLANSSWLMLCGAAAAADIPLAKSPPIIVPASWAGFYLGVHGGYGWSRNDFFQAINPFTLEGIGDIKSRGPVYGGQVGYNWQVGRVVTGVEIDFSAADIKGGGSSLSSFFPGQGALSLNFSDHTKYLGTTRARLGWLPADNFLIYGTAGVAWARVDELASETIGPPANASITETQPFDRFGWTAGAGVEAMLPGSNWIGRLEYLHYDFGAVRQTQTNVTTAPFGTSFDRPGSYTLDVVRAALSYKFGAPASATGVAHAKSSYAEPSYAKAPPTAVASSWTGFYIGAHGGYGWGKNDFSLPVNGAPPVNIGGTNLKGGVYGAHAGHNWQFDRAVAGFELDFSGTGVRGSAQASFAVPPTTENNSLTDKVTYLGSARARLGWLPIENVMLYGTAGLGWERLDRTAVRTETTPAGTTTVLSDRSSDHFGWVAGAGAEFMLNGTNWIGRLEYLHYEFGTAEGSGTFTVPAGSATTSAGSHHLDILRAGLSYKFGEPVAGSPVRYAKAPPTTPTSTWAGFYLGVHGGYGWKDNDFTEVILFLTATQTGGIKSRGWLAGGHAGYNWQYDRLVTGFETDFSTGDLSGRSAAVVSNIGGGTTETETLSDKVRYLGTARARLGWTPSDAVLLYVTGGLAWERLERSDTTVDAAPGFLQTRVFTTRSNRFGGVIGAGAEWMPWGPNWIGRVEYLHYDFGKFESTTTFTSSVPGDLPYSEHRGRQTIDMVRAGVSYKFQ